MPPLLFPTFDLSAKQIDLVTQVFEMLKPSYPEAAFEFDYQPPLSTYEAIRGNYSGIKCGPVLCLCSDPAGRYLCFADLSCPSLEGRYSPSVYYDFQTWGIAILQRKYGHLLVKPETMLDKVRELIHHVEVHFPEDKEFSDRFYVLSNNEDDARNLLGPRMRQLIAGLQLKDFTVEVIDNVMIVGDNKCADPATASEMASFLCALSRLT